MSVENKARECDVLIIGGGIAGGCLARQLRLQQPDLKIILIDKKTEFDWWVGESSLEVWDDYAIRVLKLGQYLHSSHIQKHALRWYFDSEKKDLPLHEMSEIGWSRYPTTRTAWQLDRKKFDWDLCEINKKSGVEVLMGTHVLSNKELPEKPAGDDKFAGIKIDGEKGHVVETSAGPIKCKWLVDAAGRPSPLTQKFDLAREASELPSSSYWGRYEGQVLLDDLVSEEQRRQSFYTMRWRSTSHFLYKGYWIWHIPVSDTITSIGVSYDRNFLPVTFKNGEELTAFFRSHRALSDILGPETKMLDFMGLKTLARGSNYQFSKDRWFLTGMSAGFVDPLFSFQCVILTASNQLICELIKTDREGDKAKLENRLTHFNFMMRLMYDEIRNKLSDGRFGALGCFDAFVAWLSVGFNGYMNTTIPDFCTDLKYTIDIFDSHQGLAECGCETEGRAMHERMTNQYASDRVRDEFLAFLEEHKAYYGRNKGHYWESFPTEYLVQKSYSLKRDFEVETKNAMEYYEAFFRYYIHRMATIEGTPFNEEVFVKHFVPDNMAKQKLIDVLGPMREAAKNPKPKAVAPRQHEGKRWTIKGLVDERELRSVHGWNYVFKGAKGEDLNEELNEPDDMPAAAEE